MARTRWILIPVTLGLAALACTLNFNLPVETEVKTGPTVIDEVTIPYFGDPGQTVELTLKFAAGELNLSGGGQDVLNGTATYNVSDLKPEIAITNNRVEVSTGNLEIDGIPDFKEKIKNTWDFQLGPYPTDLTIKAGAYKGELALGGVPLVNLSVSDGAAEVNLDFDQPNPVEMNTLRYETGASDISLRKLGNANFAIMLFQSGAGTYELDFTGEMRRDAQVFIETGLSSLTITVPEGVNVLVNVEGALTNISTWGGWEQEGNKYTRSGEGASLTITIEMSAGNLILRTE